MEQSSTCKIGPLKKKIYDGEYFEILDQDNELLIVRCTSCPPSLQLRASTRSNGNIIKHIQRRHPELLSKIRTEKNLRSRCNRYSCLGESPISQGTPKIFKHPPVKNETPVHMCGNDNNYVEHDGEYQIGDTTTNDSHNSAIRCIRSTDMLPNTTDDHSVSTPIEPTTRNLLEQAIAQATEVEFLVESEAEDNYDLSTSGGCGADGGSVDPLGACSSSSIKHWPTGDKANPMLNQEIIALQKELMLREFEEMQDMRRQKHRYEIEILRQDLEFKKIEHRKKIEILDKKLKG